MSSYSPARCLRLSPERARSLAAMQGFTLVELLVVIAIIIAMTAIAVPAFNAMKGAGDFASSVSEIQGLVDKSRAYAVANHTYVYLGFFEEDGSKEPDPSNLATAGVGRVVMAAIARKDGMRGYSLNSALTDPVWKESDGSDYGTGARFIALGGLRRIKNMHLSDKMNGKSVAGVTVPTSGNMKRPTPTNNYVIGNAACKSITPFTWPLGKALGGGQYSFTKVIQFNPEGAARIQYATNEDNVVYWMEISLQETRGNAIPAAPTDQNIGQLDAGKFGKLAAIVISGMTGVAKTYRP